MIILRKMIYFPRHIRFYKNRFLKDKDFKRHVKPKLTGLYSFGRFFIFFRDVSFHCMYHSSWSLEKQKGHIQRHFLEPKYKKYFGQTHVSHLCPSEHMFLLLEKRNRNIFLLYYIYLKPKVKDTWATLNNIIPVSLFH